MTSRNEHIVGSEPEELHEAGCPMRGVSKFTVDYTKRAQPEGEFSTGETYRAVFKGAPLKDASIGCDCFVSEGSAGDVVHGADDTNGRIDGQEK